MARMMAPFAMPGSTFCEATTDRRFMGVSLAWPAQGRLVEDRGPSA